MRASFANHSSLIYAKFAEPLLGAGDPAVGRGGDTEAVLSGGDREQTVRATWGGDVQAAGGDTEGQESLWMRFVLSWGLEGPSAEEQA